jgi:hypothetical protein
MKKTSLLLVLGCILACVAACAEVENDEAAIESVEHELNEQRCPETMFMRLRAVGAPAEWQGELTPIPLLSHPLGSICSYRARGTMVVKRRLPTTGVCQPPPFGGPNSSYVQCRYGSYRWRIECPNSQVFPSRPEQYIVSPGQSPLPVQPWYDIRLPDNLWPATRPIYAAIHDGLNLSCHYDVSQHTLAYYRWNIAQPGD